MATVVVVSPSCKLRLAKSIVFWGRGGPGGRRGLLALAGSPNAPNGADILRLPSEQARNEGATLLSCSVNVVLGYLAQARLE